MYPRYRGRWLAGIAPVGNTELTVIVQRRYDDAIEPRKSLGRHPARPGRQCHRARPGPYLDLFFWGGVLLCLVALVFMTGVAAYRLLGAENTWTPVVLSSPRPEGPVAP
jgi:hypothetical protein